MRKGLVGYDVDIASQRTLHSMMDALVAYNGQLLDTYRFSGIRFRCILRVAFRPDDKHAVEQQTRVELTEPPRMRIPAPIVDELPDLDEAQASPPQLDEYDGG